MSCNNLPRNRMAPLMQSQSLYSKNDIFLFENLKGVAIILVVIFHSTWAAVALPFVPLTMPLFAFVSGFWCKDQKSLKLNYLKKVGVLYLMGSVLYGLPNIFKIKQYGLEYLPTLIIGPNRIILWFFIALLVWALVTPLITNLKHPIIIGCILSLCASFTVSNIQIGDNPEYLNAYLQILVNILKFYPYYLIGVLCPWEWIIKIRRSGAIRFLLLPVAIIIAAIYGQGLLTLSSQGSFIREIAYLVSSLILITSAVGLFWGMKVKILTDIGKNSLVVYLLHAYFLTLIGIMTQSLSSALSFGCFLFGLAIFLLICIRPFFVKSINKLLSLSVAAFFKS